MWDEHVQRLIQFQQQHGHCEVPHDSDEYQDLSAWIRQVRSSYVSWMYEDGDEDETGLELTQERIADLQNLGLELYLLGPVKRGKRRIKELVAYKRLYGHHYRGPCSGSADFPKLNAWLKKLRAAHDKRRNEEIPILMDVQLTQLEKIGYDFNDLTELGEPAGRGSNEENWNRRVEELKEFKRIHGHFRVPSTKPEYTSLYHWIYHYRCDYKRKMKGEKTKRRITDDRVLELKAIGFDLMEKRTRWDFHWEERVRELKEFKATYGHFRVSGDGDHKSLRSWLSGCLDDFKKIRNGEKAKTLTEERIQSLRSIGFEFTDSTNCDISKPVEPSSSPVITDSTNSSCEPAKSSDKTEDWDDGVQQLKKFKELHGHFRVPADTEEYKPLHHWLHTHHEEYKKLAKGGKSNRLTNERITQLNRIGYYFGTFSSNPPSGGGCESTESSTKPHVDPAGRRRRTSFDERLIELRDFKKRHGHCRVPSNREEYSLLYRWVYDCCQRYKNRVRGEKHALSDEQISKLRDVGIEFPTVESWDERVHELIKFREIHGHFLVSRFTGNYQALGLWVYNCQLDFMRVKRGEQPYRMAPDLVRQLEAIGFNLEGPFADDEIWTRGLQELRKFILEYGHVNVPKNDEKYRSLCHWLRDTRKEYKKLKNGERSLWTKDRIRQFVEIEMLLKEPRAVSTHENIGTPEASNRRTLSSSSELRVPTVTPQHQSDAIMHRERDQDDDEVRVVLVRSPHQQGSHVESNNHHASRIHHPQWQQRAWAPMYSDGQNYRYNHGVDDTTYNTFQPPQAPGHGHVHPVEMFPFLDGLEDAVESMMEEMNRVEQNRANGCSGRPNQFWLEIGDRDGIDFFSSS